MFSKLSNHQLYNLCKDLNIRRGNREEMVHNLSARVLNHSRKRRRKEYDAENDTDDDTTLNHPKTKKPRFIKTDNISPPSSPTKSHRLLSAIKIQKWWRKVYQVFVNPTDFVTLEPITKRFFKLIEAENMIFRFDPVSLGKYFLENGLFHNPYTRRPLNEVELRRLDKSIHEYDPTFTSLYTYHQDIARCRAEQREHEQTCELLHQESLRVLSDLLTLTNYDQRQQRTFGRHYRRNNNNNNNINMMYTMGVVVDEILPQYFNTFRQLYLFDNNFATDSVLNVISKLETMLADHEICATEERTFVLKYCQTAIVNFAVHILPVLHTLLPEMLENVEVDENVVR